MPPPVNPDVLTDASAPPPSATAAPMVPTSTVPAFTGHRVTAMEDMLRLVLDEGAAVSSGLGSSYQRLWRSLTDATDGGKRFRPALFAVSYRAWGGDDDVAAASVGAAIELLHTAFVVHDDVIDGDDVRRGQLNVSGSHVEQAALAGAGHERCRQYGAAAGILAGDLALAAALRTVATCAAPAPTVRRLLDLFDEVLHATAAGELADVWMSLGTDEPSVDEVLTMAERKTGEYSFALPLQAAAVLAGSPPSMVRAAGDVGRALGIAYQLTDDLQGVFGNPLSTGKSVLSDLRSGKHTALVAHARGTAAWPAIAPYVGLATLSEEQAEVARRLLTTCGSRRFVEELAAHHLDRAMLLSHEAGMPASLLDWFTWMRADLLGTAA